MIHLQLILRGIYLQLNEMKIKRIVIIISNILVVDILRQIKYKKHDT